MGVARVIMTFEKGLYSSWPRGQWSV